MGEAVPPDRAALLREGTARLEVAQARLGATDGSTRHASAIIDDAADELAALARAADCPELVEVVLLDLRDRLGSFVLSARWLADADVHESAQVDLLTRGLDAALAEAHRQVRRLSASTDLLPDALV